MEKPWSLTPYKAELSPERPKEKAEEGKKERRRRLALPGHGYVDKDQEISLGAKGHFDKDRHGRIKPWKMLRDKKVYNQEEEEKKEEFIRKVAKSLKAKEVEGGEEEGGGEDEAGGSGKGGPASVYGPALPGNIKAPVELERWEKSAESLPAGVFSTAGKKQAAAGLEIRQCTGEVPSGTRPDRYGGRFFKEPAVPAAEESPRLAPTAAVADFKRRRQETAAERLARKASKSHKQNLDEYNELMEKIPVHRQKAEEAKEEAVEEAVEGVDVNELVKRKVPRLSMTCYPQGIKNQSKAEVIKDIKGLNRSAHVKSMNKGRSCGDCGKMFAGRAGLRYHKKKEHGVVSVQAWNLVGDEVLERRGGVREKVQVEVKAEVEDTFCNLDPLSP